MSHVAFKARELPAVVCADRFFMTDEAIEVLESAGKVIWANSKSEDELVKEVRYANAKVIISEYFNITDRVIDASDNLKGVVVWGVGYDHVDVKASSERGIYVCNTRGSNVESVSEHVFAFMLGLSRKLLRADSFVRKGGWMTREEAGLPHELVANDLNGKTLGIVGLGAIGSRVARIGRGFSMRLLVHDPYVSVGTAKDMGAELVDLKKLLTESDFITLHVILTEDTKSMISTRELNLMKPTAYLINASRGPVIDEKALIEALSEKKIAGVGLDVFTEEPISLDNPLLKFDNVILTPHCAGSSKEAIETTSLIASQEAVRILRDEIPKNFVNRQELLKKGYLREPFIFKQ